MKKHKSLIGLQQIYIRYIRPRISIDDRTLAVFRMMIGSIIVLDTILRFRNLTFFYTASGAVPVSVAQEHLDSISILFHLTDPLSVGIVFAIKIIFGVLLILGFRSRIAALVSVILITSVDARNPFVMSYADTMLRLLVFWSVFLPLGNKWSIDALLRSDIPQDWSKINIFAGGAILIQLLSMYIVNGSLKLQHYDAWFSGWAFYSTLHFDSVTWLVGPYIREAPYWIIQAGSIYWFICMLVAPVLIVLKGRQRYPLIIALILGHTLIGLTTRVGFFSPTVIAGLLLFFQTQFWDDMRYILDRWNISFESPSINLQRWAAVVYPTQTIQSKEIKKWLRVACAVIVIFSAFYLAVLLTYSTAYTPPPESDTQQPDKTIKKIHVGYATVLLHQPKWNFYTDGSQIDNHYVIAAKTKSGNTYDLYDNTDSLTFERDYGHNLQQQYPTYRHRFYYTSISDDDYDQLRKGLADYYCESWNKNGEEIQYITIYELRNYWDSDTIGSIEEYRTSTTNMLNYSCDGSDTQVVGFPDKYD